MRARHYSAPQHVVNERLRIERRLRPSARDLFPALRERLLASRPVITPERTERPGAGGRAFDKPKVIPAVYGAPTFRNRIVDGVLQ